MSDLGVPIHFAAIEDADGVEYVQVRLCTARRATCGIYHFNASYTYVSNGAHIDMEQDGITAIRYVESFDTLRSIRPDHWLLPENKE